MKISKVDIYQCDIPLRHPYKTPIGTLAAAQNAFVRVSTDAGIAGWGEASPFPVITGDSRDSNLTAATTLARPLIGRDPVAGGIAYVTGSGGRLELPDTPGFGACLREEFLSAAHHAEVGA